MASITMLISIFAYFIGAFNIFGYMDKLIYSFMQLMKAENHISMQKEIENKTMTIEYGSYNSGDSGNILEYVLCIIMIILIPMIIFTIINIIRGYRSSKIIADKDIANVNYDELSNVEKGETSAEIKKRVNEARAVQRERYKDYGIYSNAQLSAGLLSEFCRLGEAENNILKMAFERLGMSARAHSRILKVARTIADLAGEKDISKNHIAEAIQYRSLDRKFFG